MRNREHRTYTSRVASRPAVFIDRDGTLTEEVGYVNHPSRLRLLPRSAEAIRRLNEAGVAAVRRDQPGRDRPRLLLRGRPARGERRRSSPSSRDAGAHLDGALRVHAPSDAKASRRFARTASAASPSPACSLRAAAELGLDLARSTMVGDKPSDLVPGAHGRRRARCWCSPATAWASGSTGAPRFAVEPDHVAGDLLDAVDWALARRVARVSDADAGGCCGSSTAFARRARSSSSAI